MVIRDAIWNAVIGGSGIAATILALVMVNTYEYLDVGKRFAMNLAWRSALFIGVLCGVTGDRFVAALKAFVGPTA